MTLKHATHNYKNVQSVQSVSIKNGESNVSSHNGIPSRMTHKAVKRNAFGDLSNVSREPINIHVKQERVNGIKTRDSIMSIDSKDSKDSQPMIPMNSNTNTMNANTNTINTMNTMKRKRVEDNAKGFSSVAAQVQKERALKSGRVRISCKPHSGSVNVIVKDIKADPIISQSKRVRYSQDQENIKSHQSIPTVKYQKRDSSPVKRDSGISIQSNRLSISIESIPNSTNVSFTNSTTVSSTVSSTVGIVKSIKSKTNEMVLIKPRLPILMNVDESGFLDRDPLLVAEYANEIYDYLKIHELKQMVNPSYMNYQKEINWTMRAVLVDWMSQVSFKFKFLPETLFHSVHYLDRFLSIKAMSVPKFQLAGCTCLFLASKFEEVQVPRVKHWVSFDLHLKNSTNNIY